MKKNILQNTPKNTFIPMLKKLPESVFWFFFRICHIAYIDYYQIITALKAGPNRLNFFEETDGYLGVM